MNELEATVSYQDRKGSISNAMITGIGTIFFGAHVAYNVGSIIFNYEPLHGNLDVPTANGVATTLALACGIRACDELNRLSEYFSRTTNN